LLGIQALNLRRAVIGVLLVAGNHNRRPVRATRRCACLLLLSIAKVLALLVLAGSSLLLLSGE
jgi:hypothetical protein